MKKALLLILSFVIISGVSVADDMTGRTFGYESQNSLDYYKPKSHYTKSAGIKWALPRFGGRYSMQRLTGVRTRNNRNRSLFGVSTRKIQNTLRYSRGNTRRKLFGAQRNRIFSGKRRISGFVRDKADY
ncbi:MAG: hypothetical protein H6619_01625 [Deltaproteobacteria bacterium]|nr:hypothetical protein [Deltaproteobacteria bacterium]